LKVGKAQPAGTVTSEAALYKVNLQEGDLQTM
jgi:hypothetical protein